MPLPKDIDGLSPAELKGLVLKLLEKVAELERTVAAQRDEIARLKGGPPRPNIKPSGMEQARDPKPPGSSNERRRRGNTRSKLSIDEVRNVKLAAPPGARFKGYTSFVVQDLLIRPHVVDVRRERWQTADGKVMTAPLPEGIDGHFGPQLRRFVLAQYHQGQVTMPRLAEHPDRWFADHAAWTAHLERLGIAALKVSRRDRRESDSRRSDAVRACCTPC